MGQNQKVAAYSKPKPRHEGPLRSYLAQILRQAQDDGIRRESDKALIDNLRMTQLCDFPRDKLNTKNQPQMEGPGFLGRLEMTKA